MTKKVLLTTGVILLLAVGVYFYNLFSKRTAVGRTTTNPFVAQKTEDLPRLSVIAEDLEVPWSLSFLPDRSLLVTERPGRVRLISNTGILLPEPLITLEVVKKIQGEGGLHGITIHPDFEENHFVFLYYT